MKTVVLFAVSLMLVTASYAVDPPKTNPFKETLRSAPAAELPAKAAALVKRAKASDREATTVNVVKAALEVNPTAAPSIVGAIAKAVPEMASLAAATAAAHSPRDASAIAVAAATAAPSKAGKIVEAVCRVVPKDYGMVAVMVAQRVPSANHEILNAIASAIPALKPTIETAIANAAGGALSVAAVITQVSPAPARGPAVGPPYIIPSGTPGNLNPGDTGTVPAGGRNYAAP